MGMNNRKRVIRIPPFQGLPSHLIGFLGDGIPGHQRYLALMLRYHSATLNSSFFHPGYLRLFIGRVVPKSRRHKENTSRNLQVRNVSTNPDQSNMAMKISSANMKSVAIAAAILASTAVAQPHGHHRHAHAKRDLVTEWETVWETATVIIDDETTQTLPPASTGTPAQFFQPDTSSTSAYSTSSPAPVVESPTVQPSSSTPTTIVSIAQATTYSPSTPTQAPTSTYETPTQQTTAAPVTPSTSSTYTAAAPTTSASSGGSTGSDGIPYGQKFSGDITYYNAALGACGYEDTGKDDTTNIVAIPKAFWDAISTATSYGINEPAHPLCDKTITITGSDGKTTTATIRDRCDGCAGHAIDVTPHTFNDLFGSLTGGRLEASWVINE